MLANRLFSIKPSPTLSLNQKANEMKLSGVDVINLTLGESDFDTPSYASSGASEFIRTGLTRYTAVDGVLGLKKKICDKFKNDNGLTYAPSEVMVSTGGKQVIFNAMMATLNPDDEVIIPAPYWVSYVDIVQIFGARCVMIPTSSDTDYKITPEQLENAINHRTKWLILNSPSNPTGAVYADEELLSLSKVLMTYNHVHILSDDIYEYLIYDQEKFYNIVMVEPMLQKRTLIVNGVSKSHAMTGWRIGYGAGEVSLIKAMTMLQSQSTSNPCSVAQGAALAALSNEHVLLSIWKDEYQKRRNFVVFEISKMKNFSCILPKGAFYVYVDCSSMMRHLSMATDVELCNLLLEKYHVAVVPGSAFGCDETFRVSYATSKDQLKKAMDRLHALDQCTSTND